MQKIASENNLPATAFLQQTNNRYSLRWFAPHAEIDLCGHATLTSAFVVMNHLQPGLQRVEFETKSGLLPVVRRENLYVLDFPARAPQPCPVPEGLAQALGTPIVETQRAQGLLLVLLPDEEAVAAAPPNFAPPQKTGEGFVLTATGSNCDFVSRFFKPTAAIPEDPVTGSSHCTLIPFWAARLAKTELVAKQLSKRGGTLYCRHNGARVTIGGHAVCYAEGYLQL